MKRIFKYATGEEAPEGAIYLNTVTQTKYLGVSDEWINCWLVWHYFLVEVNDDGGKK